MRKWTLRLDLIDLAKKQASFHVMFAADITDS